jgi:glycosidase
MHTSSADWWHEAQFYHIYPLGFCGAPAENPAFANKAPGDLDRRAEGAPPSDGAPPADSARPGDGAPRLQAVTDLLPSIRDAGFTALYLGPLFESTSHGYDTADYFRVDRRLGAEETLAELVRRAHELEMRVVLDGVFNHVGRDFWAFRDLRAKGRASSYTDWFKNVDFSRDNGYGDGFTYEGWEGTDSLVALNPGNPEVRAHLFDAVRHMIRSYKIDGLRLDVAYLLPYDFLEELRRVTDEAADREEAAGPTRGDASASVFRLLGEVIHGDYAALTAPGRLHSVTNYECYKGLWSSHNDVNYFEIAHSLNRLFGAGGLLRNPDGAPVPTYNFADNHDVDRVVTVLRDPEHVFPLYALLWTMPGVPSTYYGSEWMLAGSKAEGDAGLRPAWHDIPKEDDRLLRFLRELNRIRAEQAALRYGAYEELHVANESFAFLRRSGEERVLVAVNAEETPARLPVELGAATAVDLFTGDLLQQPEEAEVPAKGALILKLTG